MESLDWQPKLSTHRERCKYAFDNSLFCDVEFSVVDCDGNKVTVPANKYPLAVCSPVFEAMFYGKLAEAKSLIHIPDCTKEGLQEILRYAHYEEATLTGSNVMEVLFLATKYRMPFLEEKCKTYIREQVGWEKVLDILPHVQKLNDKDLEKHCWEVVDKNTEDTISSESFLNVSRELLCQILKRDHLEISELEIFKAVDKWVTTKIKERGLLCNGETKRFVLGEEVIRLIRFPRMDQKEFAESVLPCKILNMDEVTEIIHMFNGIRSAHATFLSKDRAALPSGILVTDIRFSHLPDPENERFWNYNGATDYLDFTVNKTVDLVGVRLFGSKGGQYSVELEIRQGPHQLSSVSSLYTTESTMTDNKYYGFTVYLDKPIRLKPAVVYSIKALISGKPSYMGDKARECVSAGSITVTFKTSTHVGNGTSSHCGQFPSLVLRRTRH